MIGAAQLAFSLAALLAAPPPPLVRAPERLTAVTELTRVDPWFGDDKLRHLAMSFASTTFAFAAGRALGLGTAAEPAAAAAALAAGIGKELYDARAGRFFSTKDLAWDLAGVLAGYALAQTAR